MYQDSFFAFWFYVVFLGVALGGYLVFDYNQCHTKAKMQGYECEWGPVQGCMVKVDGKWVDYDKWRVME